MISGDLGQPIEQLLDHQRRIEAIVAFANRIAPFGERAAPLNKPIASRAPEIHHHVNLSELAGVSMCDRQVDLGEQITHAVLHAGRGRVRTRKTCGTARSEETGRGMNVVVSKNRSKLIVGLHMQNGMLHRCWNARKVCWRIEGYRCRFTMAKSNAQRISRKNQIGRRLKSGKCLLRIIGAAHKTKQGCDDCRSPITLQTHRSPSFHDIDGAPYGAPDLAKHISR
ncbi:MAG: hypothetical protein H0U74_05645 [Bradymonadaceae bacterium]|nr:hypothetical protein [Lujinxingiaceae bacterium]